MVTRRMCGAGADERDRRKGSFVRGVFCFSADDGLASGPTRRRSTLHLGSFRPSAPTPACRARAATLSSLRGRPPFFFHSSLTESARFSFSLPVRSSGVAVAAVALHRRASLTAGVLFIAITARHSDVRASSHPPLPSSPLEPGGGGVPRKHHHCFSKEGAPHRPAAIALPCVNKERKTRGCRRVRTAHRPSGSPTSEPRPTTPRGEEESSPGAAPPFNWLRSVYFNGEF
ncbi:hypothetical protein HPB50_003367 [Hyalomma asiaticum]|uniref:Uncharacterized protein n=1 Tax=Hyalomma asiaticum TaxID=266040 RepID=A0ACB7TC11_HYAAI|nr:hypothetical protein HPB50_003367 [Hyalomma asiaticum]